MELLATLLGGLGLFLVGTKAVGTNPQQLAGPCMRAGFGAATRGPIPTVLIGLLLGGVTQSSNAVTFISTFPVSAGLLRIRAAMLLLAFANVGTAGLVLLATVDLRLAVLWMVGLVGVLTAFGVDRGARSRPALGALLGLGRPWFAARLRANADARAGPDGAAPGAASAGDGSRGARPAALSLRPRPGRCRDRTRAGGAG